MRDNEIEQVRSAGYGSGDSEGGVARCVLNCGLGIKEMGMRC